MVLIAVLCPHCRSDDVVRHGKNKNGIQVYRCRNKECKKTRFQLEYKNKACYLDTDKKIVEMAINGSGVRDTAEVLEISTSTVIDRLKKKKSSITK